MNFFKEKKRIDRISRETRDVDHGRNRMEQHKPAKRETEDRIHERGWMQVPTALRFPRDGERTAIGYSIAHHDIPEQA